MFKTIDKDKTQYTPKLKDNDKYYNLAVSANYHDFTSGMHWTMCLADVTSELIKLEPEIIEIKNRSITLQWNTDRVCSSHIEGFNLFYCRVSSQNEHDCLEKEKHVNISNTKKKHEIKHLKPYSSYKIQMNMYSKLKTGNLSDVKIITTQEDGKFYRWTYIKNL